VTTGRAAATDVTAVARDRLDLNSTSRLTLGTNRTSNRRKDHTVPTTNPLDLRPDSGLVRTTQDLALLVGRIGLAVLMIAHAALMFDVAGGSIVGVGQLFAQADVPLPAVTGPANLLLEAVGGLALIVGLGVPVIGLLMALNMLGAWLLVHPAPLYAADHTGPETVIAIGLLSLVVAAFGSGRFGLDPVLLRRMHRTASR
jgi:putative oxidoreductase